MQCNLEVDAVPRNRQGRGPLSAYHAMSFGAGTRHSTPAVAPSPEDKPEPAVMPLHPLVSVIDDDQSVRESLPDLLRAFGFSVRAFASAEDFLASDCVSTSDCLLLDIAMPGMTGPELQKEISRRRKLPIVFITAHADDATRSRVIGAGAIDCLLKPFSESSLLEALNSALGRSS